MISYFSETVSEIGVNANNQSANLLIFYGESAPNELKEYCLLLPRHHLEEKICPSDYFCIDNQKYKITAVGNKASEQLRDIGHLTVYFDGAKEPTQSGAIYVERSDYPFFDNGSVIEFKRHEVYLSK